MSQSSHVECALKVCEHVADAGGSIGEMTLEVMSSMRPTSAAEVLSCMKTIHKMVQACLW